MPQLRRSTPPVFKPAGANHSGSSVKQRRIGVPLPGLTIPATNGFDNIHAEGVPTSPQYDQVLEELRQAQGRRFSPRDTDLHCNGNVKPVPASVTASNPSGPHFPPKTVGQFKKVRFLEDGTGNLHTSVFGESTESVGSLLDAHENLDQSDELSFDNVISSLVNYNNNPVQQKNNECNGIMRRNGSYHPTHNPGSSGPSAGFPRSESNDIRIPSVVLEVLRCTSPEAEPRGKARVTSQHNCVKNLMETYPGDVAGQETQQSIIHLEPDDPNSVDSGSVLSELDFEETSSTVTSESNKTDSISSPVMKYQSAAMETDCDKPTSYSKPVISSDPFAELSDLLERSLQEIRWMEEDTVQKTPKPVVNPVQPEPAQMTAKREPLYELIGRKRAPPPQINIRLSPSSPIPMSRPAEDPSNGVDIWIPRADFTPPPKNLQAPKKADDVWLRRNGAISNSNGTRESGTRKAAVEDNAIYGRLWEASSSSRNAIQREANNNSSNHNNNNGKSNDKLKEGGQQNGAPDEKHDDLTVIRSMARKARFEHWRLAGISPSSPEGADASAKSENANLDANFHESSFLSSLPLFQIPSTQEGSVSTKPPAASAKPPLRAKKLAIELTWPPPPIPPSPCSSSASATPVSPTCPGFPCGNSEHSPKCFGHDSHFQWPVPALPNKQVKRSGSFRQDTLTDSMGDPKRNLVKRSESLKEKHRPTKPPSLQAAQDWYWIEEFPQGAGIEPGTGNMSIWFHGAISRTQAELRLANQPAGAFLTRLTERLWGYALSVKSASGQISHYLIDAADNHHKKYALLGSCDPPHRSLRELIQFYGKHPLGPESNEKLTFPCPQECAVRCSGSRPAVPK